MAIPHPRFLLFLAMFGAAAALLRQPLGWSPAVMLGFDIAALAFLASLFRMMNRDKAEHIRRRAAANDAGRGLLLLLAGLLLATILVTVAIGLREAIRHPTHFGVALPLLTLVVAWLFGSAVMALHYAHLYYDAVRHPTHPEEHMGDQGGLVFPQPETPLYWDFAYFSLNLGMTYQVSDVTISSPLLRRMVILHCVAAFFFNIGVLALAVSMIGGLAFAAPPR